MTWKLTIRSNPGSMVTADYECPVHGVFAATNRREENGDPAEWVNCIEVENGCVLACGVKLTAPGYVKVKAGEVVRGRSAERPPDRHVMDTSVLADGMSMEEFKKRRAAVHRDESLRRVRSALGRTGKVYR